MPDPRVARLRQGFARFRRAHKPGTRYPEALRAAVLTALRSGAAEPEVKRACGISSQQINAWRRCEMAPEQRNALVRQPARVFSVIDEAPDAQVEPVVPSAGEDMELRLGGWVVQIRRIAE